MKTFLSIITIFFSFSLVANAADVSVVAPENVTVKQNFSVFVNLNTGGVMVNSFDVKLSYPSDLVTFSGYKEDGSIKRIWLKSPSASGGEVNFSGIIPGGVDGMYDPDKDGLQPLPLIQLLFSAKNEGTGAFTLTSSEILKNDGEGTPLVHLNNNAKISISKPLEVATDTTSETQVKTDTELPEQFTIQFIPASIFSKTPSMIVFFTTDLDSGIEKYQLHTPSDKWKDVTSPLTVTKGIIKRDITIRAVDFSGNVRESYIEIPGLVSNTQFFIFLILGIICYFVFFVLKRKR